MSNNDDSIFLINHGHLTTQNSVAEPVHENGVNIKINEDCSSEVLKTSDEQETAATDISYHNSKAKSNSVNRIDNSNATQKIQEIEYTNETHHKLKLNQSNDNSTLSFALNQNSEFLKCSASISIQTHSVEPNAITSKTILTQSTTNTKYDAVVNELKHDAVITKVTRTEDYEVPLGRFTLDILPQVSGNLVNSNKDTSSDPMLNNQTAISVSGAIVSNEFIDERSKPESVPHAPVTISDSKIISYSDALTDEVKMASPRPSYSTDQYTVVSKSPSLRMKRSDPGTKRHSSKNKFPALNGTPMQSKNEKTPEKDALTNETWSGEETPPSSLTRHLLIDISATNLNDRDPHGSVAAPKISIYPAELKPGDSVFIPQPNDVIFPLSGMTQWPGNELFLSHVDSKKTEFLTCKRRSDQARIALNIIQYVVFDASTGSQRTPIARFLQKQTHVQSEPGTILPWLVMDETSILVQLGKALRGKSDLDLKRNGDKVKKRKAIELTPNSLMQGMQKKRKNKKSLDCYIENSNSEMRLDDGKDFSIEDDSDGDDPLCALKSLYTIPVEKELLVNQTATKNGENFPSKKNLDSLQLMSQAQPFHQANALRIPSLNTSTDSLHVVKKQKHTNLRQLPLSKARTVQSSSGSNGIAFRQKSSPTSADIPRSGTNDAIAVSKETTSRLSEGGIELPKGVTVRPSGKWQAQIYFCGQSRYVGVYTSSLIAAHAYRVAQAQLKIHRREVKRMGRVYGEDTKDKIAQLFCDARQVADKSVKELEAIIVAGTYQPLKTEANLLALVESEV